MLEASLIRASRAATVATVDELLKMVAELKNRPAETSSARELPESSDVKKKSSDEQERLKAAWPALIEHISKGVPHAKHYLTDTVPLNVSETLVTIGIDPEFSGERSNLENPRTLLFVRKTLSSFLKREVSAEFTVQAGQEKSVPTGEAVRGAPDKKKYYKNPSVLKVLEAFSGEITEIRE